MPSRMYKPRGSPRSSRSSRRQAVDRYRSSSRSAMYSSVRRSGRSLGKARSLGLKNARTGGLLGVETKYFDISLILTALTTPTDASGGEIDPATILCLNGVPQGDTASSRDGFKIAMKSIQIEGRIAAQRQVASLLMFRQIRLLLILSPMSLLLLSLTLKPMVLSSILKMSLLILVRMVLLLAVFFAT